MFSCTHSFFIALFCPQYNFISMQQYPALASFTWVRHWNRVYGAFTRRRSISGAYPACDGVPKSCLGILSMPKAWRWGTWLLGDQCWCATWLYEEINSCTSTKKKVFILLKICTSASFIRRGLIFICFTLSYEASAMGSCALVMLNTCYTQKLFLNGKLCMLILYSWI